MTTDDVTQRLHLDYHDDMSEMLGDEEADPTELRREKLQKRQQLILFLLVPSTLWQAVQYSAERPLDSGARFAFEGALGTALTTSLTVLTLAWAAALLYNSAQLSQLPAVEPDEREVVDNVQRVADAALSTAFLMMVASFASIIFPFSATAMGFLFFALFMFSMRFPVAKLASRV